MILSFLKQMFVLIILMHVTKVASFRMEYHDTSRGVFASTGYSQAVCKNINV